jgi:hypothetical protein
MPFLLLLMVYMPSVAGVVVVVAVLSGLRRMLGRDAAAAPPTPRPRACATPAVAAVAPAICITMLRKASNGET